LRIAAIILLILTAAPVCGQELFLYGGLNSHASLKNRSYFWGVEYFQGLGPHAAFSLAWQNEGHLTHHHRDGHAAQIWLRTARLGGKLALAAGIGPYMYFDTMPASGDRSQDDHGIAAMLSVSATWYTDSRFLVQLRSNWIEAPSGIDTCSFVLGLGYQLDAPPSPGPRPYAPRQGFRSSKNEITAYYGRTVVNDYGTGSDRAIGIEYRRALGTYVDWTVGWLKEGEDSRIFRDGPLTQLWLVRSFFDERLTLGAGAGLHLDFGNNEPYPDQEKKSAFSRIVSVTASYRIAPNWAIRAVWHRMITNYDRDTDIIMGGVSRLF